MEPREVVRRAEEIAYRAFSGMFDDNGEPLVQHSAAVVRYLIQAGCDSDRIAAGWLHDVVEDTDWSLQDLRDVGFPYRIICAVDALSQRQGEFRRQYIHRVARDAIAADVKRLGDRRSNLEPRRLELLPEDVRLRRIAKYERDERYFEEVLSS